MNAINDLLAKPLVTVAGLTITPALVLLVVVLYVVLFARR